MFIVYISYIVPVIYLHLACIPCSFCANEVDVSKTEIWGPAFNSDANVPVRYFYLQPKDASGNL